MHCAYFWMFVCDSVITTKRVTLVNGKNDRFILSEYIFNFYYGITKWHKCIYKKIWVRNYYTTRSYDSNSCEQTPINTKIDCNVIDLSLYVWSYGPQLELGRKHPATLLDHRVQNRYHNHCKNQNINQSIHHVRLHGRSSLYSLHPGS